MSRPSFIYVTYINSTPERVWQALTDPAFTRKYWVNHRNASDWKVGSEWRHEDYDDASLVDIAGHVVESSPPRHLVLTWPLRRMPRTLTRSPASPSTSRAIAMACA